MVALDLHFSILLILYGLITLVEYIIWKRRNRTISFWGIMIVTLYILLLFKVTICPIIFLREDSRQEFMTYVGSYYSCYQLIPFKTIINSFKTNTWFLQVIGNILLLSPIPILYSLLRKKMPSIKILILMGASISLIIELTQLVINIACDFPSHVVDIDDFILNTIGVTISSVILYLVHKNDYFIKVKQIFRKE